MRVEVLGEGAGPEPALNQRGGHPAGFHGERARGAKRRRRKNRGAEGGLVNLGIRTDVPLPNQLKAGRIKE